MPVTKEKPKSKPQPEEPKEKGTTRVHIWLTVEQISLLDEVSKATGLTRSFLLRDAITHWFATRAESMTEFIQQTG